MKIKPTKDNSTARKRSDAAGNQIRAVKDADLEAAAAAADRRDRELASLQATSKLFDVQASERLAKHLRGKYCWGKGTGWRQYQTEGPLCGTWQDVSDEDLIEAARKTYKRWYIQAYAIAVMEQEGGKSTALKRLMTDTGLNATVKLARGQLKVKANAWDMQPHLLCTPTGVVDLTSCELLEHRPDYYMTKTTVAEYDPDAEHPDLDAVLQAIPDSEHAFAQERFGQAITGERTPDDVALFLYGSGDNGKTTLLYGAVTWIGSYATLIADELLQEVSNKNIGSASMELWGARLAYIEEMPDTHFLDVKVLKKITSPRMRGRWLYKDPVTFDTSHSLFVTHNPFLRVAETDHGSWRRLMQWKFGIRFVDRTKKRKKLGANERYKDPTLRERVFTDPEVGKAFLAWMVKGASTWYANGKVMSPPPSTVSEATAEWRNRTDTVLRFSSSYLRIDPTYHIRTKELEKQVNRWLKQNNRPEWDGQTIKSKFMEHELFKDNGILAKYTKVGYKTSALSRLPDRFLTADWGEALPEVTTGYQAFHGIRFVFEGEAEES